MKEEKDRVRHGLASGDVRSGACSRRAGSRSTKASATAAVFVLFLVVLVSRCIISGLDIVGAHSEDVINVKKSPEKLRSPLPASHKTEFPLYCTNATRPQKCPRNYPTTHQPEYLQTTECPGYFRWIHEDLRAWKSTGITKEMMERAKGFAWFRLVILKGKVYVEHFRSFKTRDHGTIWGILQLLRLYPGQIPDLELLFSSGDRPVIMSNNYQGPNATSPPPLFGFCGRQSTLDITFPDWSFWGWADTNIGPWESTVRAIKEKADRLKWKDRVPYAFWKGNTGVAPTRQDLMKCNATGREDWGAHLYEQNWANAAREGFKGSRLEDQCTHRYKIYVEGWAWSVSEKYIMACNSMTLTIKPEFFDFFSRGMIPMEHYWPIRPHNKCRDIKFAVEWGNVHPEEAQVIGNRGSKFMEESLKMKYVYDYMFHLLTGYGKLLTYVPEIPAQAVEYCTEKMVCPADGLLKKNMLESMVASPSDSLPCTLPPPYEPGELRAFLDRKESISRQVESWEADYWNELEKVQ